LLQGQNMIYIRIAAVWRTCNFNITKAAS
jgi:hypothetical protein